MATRRKIFILIFVIAALIAAFWVINTQLSITTDTINQGIETSFNQDVPVNTLQSTPVTGMAISVIGVIPVEPVKQPVEKKRDNIVFQSESPVLGSASQVSSGSNSASQVSSGSNAAVGISIKKDPVNEKKKEMSSKGIIIF